MVEPGTPGSNTSDLSLPASERAFGGGEPTTSAAAAEEAAAEEEKKDARGLLMKALDVPEDAGWRIYGWIQNSYTGNTNGFGNGFNFGVNPNFKANSVDGEPVLPHLREAARSRTTRSTSASASTTCSATTGSSTTCRACSTAPSSPGSSPATTSPSSTARSTCPFLTKGGLDVKGGRWYTLAGYEVVPAIGRPLLSVPYMFNYGQPFTHVGVVTTLHVTDKINLYNGTINGWDRWINERYQWGYIGGFSWTSKDEKTSLAFTTVWGPNQFPSQLPGNQQIYPTGYVNVPSIAGLNNPGYHRNDRTLFTTVLTHKWTDKLTQVMETDQGWERSRSRPAARTEVNFVPDQR